MNRNRDIKNDLTAFGLLLAFAFFINRSIEIKGLYMDDLYLWSCFGEQSFLQYVFPIGSTRFRFIYNFVSYLVLGIVGTHINWLVPINIILNALLAGTIYKIGKKFSRSNAIGLLAGILYLLSRMSYYQIGQVYGLMETMALWAALGILYCLYQYLVDTKEDNRYFIRANLLYFCICFIHERYMVLLPLFFLVLVIKKQKQWKLCMVSVINFSVIQLIRILAIGTLSPAGTGGTDVADTFHISEAIRYAVSQVFYVFGVNAGPEHLNGMSWGDSPRMIQLLIIAADIVLLILVIAFIKEIIHDKEKRGIYLSHTLFFFTFIALCIGSSSVTVRVEMRWIYVSYAAALLFLCYMYGAVTCHYENTQQSALKKVIPYGCLLFLYTGFMFPVETFYRSQFPNIYLWPNQLRYNSLAEETYEKYGEEIFGKTIYILNDQYQISDFTANTFFKVYDKKREADGLEVKFIDSIREIGQVTDTMLILREEPEHQAFQDITGFVRDLKCERIKGYYLDNWMDEEAVVRVMTGSTGRIDLQCYFPGELTGKEYTQVQMNEEEPLTIKFEEQLVVVSLQAEPYETVTLNFLNHFYVKDAMEQRGQKRLSMVVDITTK